MKVTLKENKKEKRTKTTMASVPSRGLLLLVSSKLKGKTLFPEKLEDAKAIAKNLKIKTS